MAKTHSSRCSLMSGPSWFRLLDVDLSKAFVAIISPVLMSSGRHKTPANPKITEQVLEVSLGKHPGGQPRLRWKQLCSARINMLLTLLDMRNLRRNPALYLRDMQEQTHRLTG